jgi:hypothetical protein
MAGEALYFVRRRYRRVLKAKDQWLSTTSSSSVVVLVATTRRPAPASWA